MSVVTQVLFVLIPLTGFGGLQKAPAEATLPVYLKSVSASVAARDRKQPPSSWIAEVKVRVTDGWHVYADKPGDEFAIPTKLEWKLPKGLTASPAVFPEPTPGPGGAKVLSGEIVLRTTFIAGSDIKPGKLRIDGSLSSQGCNDSSCLPPSRVPVSIVIPVEKR